MPRRETAHTKARPLIVRKIARAATVPCFFNELLRGSAFMVRSEPRAETGYFLASTGLVSFLAGELEELSALAAEA